MKARPGASLGAWLPAMLVLGTLLFALAAPPPRKAPFAGSEGSIHVAVQVPPVSYVNEGDMLRFEVIEGVHLGVALGSDTKFETHGHRAEILAAPDREEAADLLAIPLSLHWRHPVEGLPVAQVVRLAHRGTSQKWQEESMFTALFTHHGELPVLSLLLPEGGLFDPDTGLMVVGNAILHAPEKVLKTDWEDPRWWKYPGNFHFRGKEWERHGRLEMIAPDGREILERQVTVRINGQMTRGFPQHALRIGFSTPVMDDVFLDDPRSGYHGFVIRAAGNDQIRAMLRDAFQHSLCAGLPFEVSGHRTCVLYINGAYWGVHHIRQRMDDVEIARRYGLPKKRITILEDEARLYRGDPRDASAFRHLATTTRYWDGKDIGWSDSLKAAMDVDGFMYYMATQMILANTDWPGQNVKFWRYNGGPTTTAPHDGRWYFIMGDSDLGYGVATGPDADLFTRVNTIEVPITWLLRGMLRNTEFRSRFIVIARELAQGPLSAERSVQKLDRFVALMAPEMARHTGRWRRPSDRDTWEEHIEVMRTFALQREASVLDQLDRYERKGE